MKIYIFMHINCYRSKNKKMLTSFKVPCLSCSFKHSPQKKQQITSQMWTTEWRLKLNAQNSQNLQQGYNNTRFNQNCYLFSMSLRCEERFSILKFVLIDVRDNSKKIRGDFIFTLGTDQAFLISTGLENSWPVPTSVLELFTSLTWINFLFWCHRAKLFQ